MWHPLKKWLKSHRTKRSSTAISFRSAAGISTSSGATVTANGTTTRSDTTTTTTTDAFCPYSNYTSGTSTSHEHKLRSQCREAFQQALEAYVQHRLNLLCAEKCFGVDEEEEQQKSAGRLRRLSVSLNSKHSRKRHSKHHMHTLTALRSHSMKMRDANNDPTYHLSQCKHFLYQSVKYYNAFVKSKALRAQRKSEHHREQKSLKKAEVYARKYTELINSSLSYWDVFTYLFKLFNSSLDEDDSPEECQPVEVAPRRAGPYRSVSVPHFGAFYNFTSDIPSCIEEEKLPLLNPTVNNRAERIDYGHSYNERNMPSLTTTENNCVESIDPVPTNHCRKFAAVNHAFIQPSPLPITFDFEILRTLANPFLPQNGNRRLQRSMSASAILPSYTEDSEYRSITPPVPIQLLHMQSVPLENVSVNGLDDIEDMLDNNLNEIQKEFSPLECNSATPPISVSNLLSSSEGGSKDHLHSGNSSIRLAERPSLLKRKSITDQEAIRHFLHTVKFDMGVFS